ncbi:response regulator transcription factor [Cohnella phaseoli]|uniref:Two-component system response regulator YesN n=1 Tax=Cohnella phaseoli TaxID=456490 RepID=A0A3D9JMF4_9BACL|nr:helix-turn-helix domain-containing protein [Cohnella phaseoli]RED75124.1 two-component system response regulator YesN [Cohnella phaseoli]
MLNVMVVDDDKLARQGIIAVMPWDVFDMQVVAEAASGEQALALLKQQHVDLLITDLAMPAMSGLDLIRQVREQYPHIWNVILTFHQEFGLIQEALRLGAIDYIAKIQMEQAKMEDVLGRIDARIRLEYAQRELLAHNRQGLNAALPEHEVEGPSTWLAFFAVEEEAKLEQLYELPLVIATNVVEVTYRAWVVKLPQPPGSQPMSEQEIVQQVERAGLRRGGWKLVYIPNWQHMNVDILRRLLAIYKDRQLFYHFRANQLLHVLPADQLQVKLPEWTDQEVDELREQWSKLLWVLEEEVYSGLLETIEQLYLPLPQLKAVFYTARLNWQKVVQDETTNSFQLPGSFAYWGEWMDWLEYVRTFMAQKFRKSGYYDEIQRGIMKVLAYIDRHISSEIRHSELAKEAMMSKGYFSRCFKQVVGKPFQDYIRDARVERAQMLLEQTTLPIYKVAEKCGYPNEKYFSRIYRAQTGELPSEFRLRHTKCEG